MTLYTLALFLHVSGAAGIFIGMGTQLLCLVVLRRTRSVEQVRAVAEVITLTDPISVASALLTIAAGLYMALTVWSLQPGWIAVALGTIVLLLPPLIAGLIEPRMRAIVAAAKTSPGGPVPAALASRIHDPLLGGALQTAATLVLGIVFLMTTKPDLAGALSAMAVALTAGLASGLPLWRAARLYKAR